MSNGFSLGGVDIITTGGVARAPSVAGIADEAVRTKQDACICIGCVDINVAHAIAWCFSFTMAGTKVTGGVITGGDGADGGGGGDVVSGATAIEGGSGEVVGGGEAVGIGDAASGEDVMAAGIADWVVAGGEEGGDAVVPKDGDDWIGGDGDESRAFIRSLSWRTVS